MKYYNHGFTPVRGLYSEGVKQLAESNNLRWLIASVFKHINDLDHAEGLVYVTLKRICDQEFSLTIEDKIAFRIEKIIPYDEYPRDKLELHLRFVEYFKNKKVWGLTLIGEE